MCSTNSDTIGDATDPSTSASAGAATSATSSASAPSRVARARPAASAGSGVRGLSCTAASVRPPSSISGWIGATKPAVMSALDQPGAMAGPAYRVVSTSTRCTGPGAAARTCSARSSSRAGLGYTPCSVPLGAAVSVGSPPPMSTTVPGSGPVTTRVTSRSVWLRVSSAAAPVSSLAAEPGTRPLPGSRCQRGRPEAGSMTTPENVPSPLAFASGSSAAASPAAVGSGASTGSGAERGNAAPRRSAAGVPGRGRCTSAGARERDRAAGGRRDGEHDEDRGDPAQTAAGNADAVADPLPEARVHFHLLSRSADHPDPVHQTRAARRRRPLSVPDQQEAGPWTST